MKWDERKWGDKRLMIWAIVIFVVCFIIAALRDTVEAPDWWYR
jgi:Ni,Fe-hydrogenase I cytochrome b subunit